MNVDSKIVSVFVGFLLDVGIIILITPIAGWTLMKLVENLEKAKISKRKMDIWIAYCTIAFVILFFLKFPMWR